MTTEELKQLADLSDEVIKLKAKIIKIRSELLASSLFGENEADENQPTCLGAAQTDAKPVLAVRAYKCRLCGKVVHRESEKQWINSYCDITGLYARLMLVKL